jgi:hypothetical protein
MSRKSLILGMVVALLLVGATSAVLITLLRYEDSEFRTCSLPPGAERKEQCNAFLQEIVDLKDNIQDNSKSPLWGAEFTEKQINSFFDDGLSGSGWEESFDREGIHDPKVIV